MSRELIVFKKRQYSYLKKEYEKKGYNLFSFSSASNTNSLEDLIYDNSKLVIDISSLGTVILSNDSNLYNIEQLILCFPENTIFISDIDDEDYRYKLRYCFDNFIEYQNENIPKDTDKLNNQTDKKVKKIIDLDNKKLEEFFKKFNKSLYGHEKFKKEFKEKVYSFRVFNEIGEHKILSLFLMGDSGVGKTEVARSIHKSIGSKKRLAKINFGNYSSQDALNSLIGSPRGYIGSDGGELFDKVEDSDIGLILIDEFEKANTPVFNYFLDVLETGKATNSLGIEIDLEGYIIIFTSNLKKNKFDDSFSPELRSRFDYKGYFNLLTNEDKEKYLKFRFNNIIKKYNDKHGSKLNKATHANLMFKVNVNDYSNMRLLNSKIKKVFVDYLKERGKI